VKSLIRTLLSYIRHAPDRIAHRRRREAAVHTLAGRGPVRSVLWVCYGNICRSPYAEAVFRAAMEKTGQPVTAFSAGFVGPNRPSPPEAIEVARSRGHDLTPHRSQLIASTSEMADVAVVMEPRQKPALIREAGYAPERVFVFGDFDPEPIAKRTIFDPFGRPAPYFEASYDRIDRCMRTFLDAFPAADERSEGNGTRSTEQHGT
jgi:protein-tyrosine phosphatase